MKHQLRRHGGHRLIDAERIKEQTGQDFSLSFYTLNVEFKILNRSTTQLFIKKGPLSSHCIDLQSFKPSRHLNIPLSQAEHLARVLNTITSQDIVTEWEKQEEKK
jgi:hypothetical protein